MEYWIFFKDAINSILNNECVIYFFDKVLKYDYTIYLVVFVALVCFLRAISFQCKFFLKNVSFCDRLGLSLLILSILVEMFLLMEDSVNIKNTDVSIERQFCLLLFGLFSFSFIFWFFSRKNSIKNKDFMVLVGVLGIMQTAISMNVSSAKNILFNVTFAHGVFYILIPAYLIHEITPSNKDVMEKLDDNYQKIKTELNRNTSSEKKKAKSKFCKYFKFHSKKENTYK